MELRAETLTEKIDGPETDNHEPPEDNEMSQAGKRIVEQSLLTESESGDTSQTTADIYPSLGLFEFSQQSDITADNESENRDAAEKDQIKRDFFETLRRYFRQLLHFSFSDGLKAGRPNFLGWSLRRLSVIITGWFITVKRKAGRSNLHGLRLSMRRQQCPLLLNRRSIKQLTNNRRRNNFPRSYGSVV